MVHDLSRHRHVFRKGSMPANSEKFVVRAAFRHAIGASQAPSAGDGWHHGDPVSCGKPMIAPPALGDDACKFVPENHGVGRRHPSLSDVDVGAAHACNCDADE
ncbi:hypothetical protein KQR54_19290 [Mycobacterium gordonae]|nr:hypothetical protein [Mycobacterium gordonae]MCQ4363244.1 hypothetical protein [Mycobacterium gordonae]